mgnify:CR=1 FL=1
MALQRPSNLNARHNSNAARHTDFSTMSAYEYKTFVLGALISPHRQYAQILIDCSSGGNCVGSNDTMINELRTQYESTYTAEELEFSDENEAEHFVNSIARRGAIELLASGRSSTNTLEQLFMMDEDDATACVKLTSDTVHQMNEIIQTAEKMAKDDQIPNEYKL